jgi:hypothetical protein
MEENIEGDRDSTDDGDDGDPDDNEDNDDDDNGEVICKLNENVAPLLPASSLFFAHIFPPCASIMDSVTLQATDQVSLKEQQSLLE